MAVITIKFPDKEPYALKSIGIHNLPAAIDIRNEDILRKLEVERGKPESADLICTLTAHVEYPRRTGIYLKANKPQDITQVTYKRFILFQME
jgi:hypothetical protein